MWGYYMGNPKGGVCVCRRSCCPRALGLSVQAAKALDVSLSSTTRREVKPLVVLSLSSQSQTSPSPVCYVRGTEHMNIKCRAVIVPELRCVCYVFLCAYVCL